MADTNNQEPRIAVVGVGSAAARLVDRMALAPLPLRYLAADGDRRVLESVTVPVMPLGGESVARLGTGGDPRRGRDWATASAGELLGRLDPVAAVIGVVFLGGGTGSGAAPVLFSEVFRRGIYTAVLAVMPLAAEGRRRHQVAAAALEALGQSTDVVVRADADDLLGAVSGDLPVEKAFEKVSLMLAGALQVLGSVVSGDCLINVSLADLAGAAGGDGGRLLRVVFCGDDAQLGRAELAPSGSAAEKGILLLLAGRDTPMQRLTAAVERVRERLPGLNDLKVGAAVDRQKKTRLQILLLTAARPAAEPGRREQPARAGSAGEVVQEEFVFEPAARGRFRDVSPTLHGGEDLDVPTFIRRKIRLRGAPRPR